VEELYPPEGEQGLEWLLLTREPVDTFEEALRVVEDYECRWTIECFHKMWKTGCRLEERPFQQLDTVERMMVICAAIAIRLMQLHRLANCANETTSCEAVLSQDEWQCLWTLMDSSHDLPKEVPSALWAWRAIAKLGGWYDSKRTGRVGWNTVWKGWFLLQERVIGWRAAKHMLNSVGGNK